MYNILKLTHSYWAYLVFIVVLLSCIYSMFSYLKKKEFKPQHFRLGLFSLILTHTQLLLAIPLFLLGNDFGETDFTEIMSIPALRLKNLTHPFGMIFVIALITIGYSKHKKVRTSTNKLKYLSLFYSLAFIIMLVMIPWENWIGFQ